MGYQRRVMGEAVDSGSFTVGVPLNEECETVNSTATPGSLVEIDSRGGGGEPSHPTVTFEQGYSSGEMSGLAFGMVFGGLLIAGVIYFFALRNNVRAGIPVMRGLDNPLTGLSNLTGLGKT